MLTCMPRRARDVRYQYRGLVFANLDLDFEKALQEEQRHIDIRSIANKMKL